MFPVIHVMLSGIATRVHISSVADIADLIGSPHIEALSSTDDIAGGVDFWFSPSMHRGQRLNGLATELFLKATGFSARTVPFLYGPVILTSHDHDGHPAGISQGIIDALTPHRPTWTQQWVLARRAACAPRLSQAARRQGHR